MKIILILITIIAALSCSNKKTSENYEIVNTYNFDWLQGSWIRTNDDIGKQTFENWEKIDSNNYIGLGCTLMKSDTTFKEDLRLIRNNGSWTFEVRGVNTEMTPFTIIEQTDTSFLCENQKNEFPKRIEYIFHNKTLTAKISDEKMEIPFIFEKIEK